MSSHTPYDATSRRVTTQLSQFHCSPSPSPRICPLHSAAILLKYLPVSGSQLEIHHFQNLGERQNYNTLCGACRGCVVPRWACGGLQVGRCNCGTPRFFVLLNLCFAWMPFEVGASRLSYQKPGQVFYNYKRECPHADGLALTLEFAVEKADRAYGDESSAQVLFDYVLLMKSSRFEVLFGTPLLCWGDSISFLRHTARSSRVRARGNWDGEVSVLFAAGGR